MTLKKELLKLKNSYESYSIEYFVQSSLVSDQTFSFCRDAVFKIRVKDNARLIASPDSRFLEDVVVFEFKEGDYEIVFYREPVKLNPSNEDDFEYWLKVFKI